jgi:hypothetical protein
VSPLASWFVMGGVVIVALIITLVILYVDERLR